MSNKCIRESAELLVKSYLSEGKINWEPTSSARSDTAMWKFINGELRSKRAYFVSFKDSSKLIRSIKNKLQILDTVEGITVYLSETPSGKEFILADDGSNGIVVADEKDLDEVESVISDKGVKF